MNQRHDRAGEEPIRRRERIRRKKRKRLLRKIRNSCVLTLCLFLFGAVLWNKASFFLNKNESTPEVGKPLERTEDEVLSYLKKQADKNKEYKEICENPDDYPPALLAALANNPEMLSFVKGYPASDRAAEGKLTQKEQTEDYPLFLQWDSRWGYASYGGSNIGISGCGPTCLAMAAYSLTRDVQITPDKVAAYSEAQGFYVEGTGTSWSLMSEGASDFGIKGTELSLDEGRMKQELDNGHPIICAMRAGDFTTAGHFILIYGYDKEGFFINDPNCIFRSKCKWSYDELHSQIKNLWYFQ